LQRVLVFLLWSGRYLDQIQIDYFIAAQDLALTRKTLFGGLGRFSRRRPKLLS